MPAKPLPDWAREVKRLRESIHLSQAEFGRALGIVAMVVSDWERGKKEPAAERYIQMGKMALPPDCWFFFEKAGLTRSDIYRLLPEIQAAVLDRVEKQRLPEIKVLPASKVKGVKATKVGYVALPLLKNEAAAGAPRLVDEREVDDYIIVPAKQARPGPDWLTCIRVKGDSMEPVLKEGYVVAIDSSLNDPRRLRGKMVLALQDEGATIKWLDRIGDQWVLTPENKTYNQRPLGPDDRIIGRVAWWYGHQE
ncbi:MAG: S24 family peptidase [Terriglobia bacterium]